MYYLLLFLLQRYNKKMKPPNFRATFLRNNNYFLEKMDSTITAVSIFRRICPSILTIKTVRDVIQAGLEPALSHS